MNILSKLFNYNASLKEGAIKFGRTGAIADSEEQMNLLEAADLHYEDGEYIESYMTLLEFYKTIGGDAVEYEIDENTTYLRFSMIHGSKVVTGIITSEEVAVQSIIATFSKPDVALMRFLLHANANVEYSKFGIVRENVVLCQHCPIVDMSPLAFRDMLTEIALNSNEAGETISADFPELAVTMMDNIIELPENEKKTKLTFLKIWIRESFELVESTENENIKTYVILRVVFKILYLISPEGALFNQMKSILEIYSNYNSEEGNVTEVNYKMLEILEDVLSIPDHELAKSLYRTYTVFPELNYISYMEMFDTIDNLMKLPQQCLDIRRPDLIIVMCEYIIGSQLARFVVHPVAYDFLLLLWRVTNAEFFYGLGFRNILYNETMDTLSEERIKNEIVQLIEKYSPLYPIEEVPLDFLSFDTIEQFTCSYLVLLKHLPIKD